MVVAPFRIDASAWASCPAPAACSPVAPRTCWARVRVACPALMMSRAARPCSPIAWATCRAILRIWPVAWTIPCAAFVCSAEAVAACRAWAAVVPIAFTTCRPASSCSSDARAIWATSWVASRTPPRIFFSPSIPFSARAPLSCATRAPSADAATAS